MVNPGKALENVGRNDLVIAEVFQSFSTKIRMVFHGNALKTHVQLRAFARSFSTRSNPDVVI
jgi:hypothetical protein